MTVLLVVIGLGAVIGGLFTLGFWVGRGVREDQAADASARRQLAALEARRARPALEARGARPALEAPAAGPDWYAPPRYMTHLPMAGRLSAAPAPMTAGHAGPARPPTSPDDLEADVARMCDETELYVAALIARTRHAERNPE